MRRLFFWEVTRAVQYDIIVGLILAFIFLTPARCSKINRAL